MGSDSDCLVADGRLASLASRSASNVKGQCRPQTILVQLLTDPLPENVILFISSWP